ncbi:hypothetical protein QCA50_018791 [Cerrena zonata]|uniref:Uncharacterized protein n=1 Tax=Cerrena zonata TaxID=2478898 RepID=A0AAW0FCG5_9APHY
MSLITRKQQEIIDEAISSYIKNYDKVAQQYSKLRQEIYETSNDILELVEKEEKVSETDKIRLEKLTYEYNKIAEIYSLHINRLGHNIEINRSIKPQYLGDLESQYDKLSERKGQLKSSISDFKDNKKPLIDDMNALLTNFQTEVVSKRARAKIINKANDQEYSNTSRKINPESSVFTHQELKDLFTDIDSKLRQLKTVDEVGEEDEHIKNERAYIRLDSDKILYDISKARPIDAGNSSTVVDEYDKSIENLTINIKDLIEHGAEAKERWSLNAKKIELMKQVLQSFDDSMEIDN